MAASLKAVLRADSSLFPDIALPTNAGSEDSNYQIGIAALVLYGFAMVAIMIAVAVDGLVSGGLARQIVEAQGPRGRVGEFFLVASSSAIVLGRRR